MAGRGGGRDKCREKRRGGTWGNKRMDEKKRSQAGKSVRRRGRVTLTGQKGGRGKGAGQQRTSWQRMEVEKESVMSKEKGTWEKCV